MKHSGNITRLLYIITPLVLLVTFSAFHGRFEEQQALESARLAAIQHEEEEAARLEQAEMEARLEAEGRMIAEAKAKAQAEKEEAERKEREERFAEVRARLEAASKDLQRLTANVTELEENVKTTRAKRVATEDEAFDLATELERKRAKKSAAELENQRLVGMIMDRFNSEWAAQLTTPALPPDSGR